MAEAATLTLAEFLLARIAEDEADARDTDPLMPGAVFDHDVSGWWRTDRVLAECEAKRRIVERARELIPHVVVEDCWYTCTAATEDRDGGECCDDQRRGSGCDCGSDVRVGLLLRLLAAPYADHPDYRQEWRP